jgi:hypothetical protein
MKVIAFASGLLFCCCATASVSESPLETHFAGTWTGTATLSGIGRNPIPYSVPLTVVASGNTATLANVCPGIVQNDSMRGLGRLTTDSARPPAAVTATGSGAWASWAGVLDCPQIELRGCNEVSIRYSEVRMMLSGSNQLTVVATGNAQGCGIANSVFLSFVGEK